MSGGRRIRTWTVHFGPLKNVYYTWYHAEQWKRADPQRDRLLRDGRL